MRVGRTRWLQRGTITIKQRRAFLVATTRFGQGEEAIGLVLRDRPMRLPRLDR